MNALALLPLADDSTVAALLSTLDRWSLLVGALLPAAIAVVNRHLWPGWVKLFVSALCCVIAALGTVYFAGQWNTRDVVGSLVLVMFTAYTSFHLAWKPSGAADRIEVATG